MTKKRISNELLSESYYFSNAACAAPVCNPSRAAFFSTANHYKNPDYNVGYATAPSPIGPWTKYEGNPVIKQSKEAVGIGSGEFIRNPSGELLFFYHAHHNLEKVSPRRVVYSEVEFVPDNKGGPDVVEMRNKYFPVRVGN